MGNNKDLNKRAFTAGIFFIVSQFLVRGLSFLVTPIYTRLLTTEQYGIVKIYESWLLIFVPIVTLGLYRSVEVAKYDYKKNFNNYVSSTVILGAVLCIVFAVICIVFRKWVCDFLDFTPWMLGIMLLYLFAEFSIMCYQRREKQEMRFKNSVLFTIVTVPVATLTSVGLLFYGKNQGQTENMLFYRIAGYYIPLIIGGFIIAVIMIFQGKPKTLKADWKYGVVYSVPLIAELLSIQIMNQIDKIMIQKMVGSSEAGIYSLATTISYIIWIIEDSVWSAWLPWLYEKIDNKEDNEVQKPWIFMMHVFGILSLAIVAVTPEAISVLGGSEYKTAIYIVAPLVVSTLFRFYGYSFSAIQNFEKKTKYVALGTVISMLINVAANYIGIKHWGYIAAAYATAISYFILLIIQALFEKKVTGRIVMPLGKTLLISLVYFAVCELFIGLYSVHFLIRYAVIAVILLIFVFTKKNQLIGMVKSLKKKKD